MATYGKFNTIDEVYAVITGVVKRNNPNISRSVFNKIIVETGLEPLDKGSFKLTINTIKERQDLRDIYLKSVSGKYTLSDILVYQPVSDIDLHDIVTPMAVDRFVTQKQTRDFNKAQRAGSAQKYLADSISKSVAKELKEELLNDTSSTFTPSFTDDGLSRTMAVITPSDWHIGESINDVDGNTYNIHVAEQRLEQYISQVDRYLDLYHPETIVLVHLGDLINHAYMHSMSQAYETDLDVSEQLGKAIRFFTRMLVHFASKAPKVIVGAIAGNHDRMSGNKKEAIYNDSVVYNVVDTIILLDNMNALPANVSILDNRSDLYSLEVNELGKNLLFVHGDHESRNDNAKIPSHIVDHSYDALFMGHYHYLKSIQEDFSRMSYMSGSLAGANSYSKSIGAPKTEASQLLTIFEEGNKTAVSIPIFFSI